MNAFVNAADAIMEVDRLEALKFERPIVSDSRREFGVVKGASRDVGMTTSQFNPWGSQMAATPNIIVSLNGTAGASLSLSLADVDRQPAE